MGITLVVMTDGRLDCLARSLTTVNRLHGDITRRVLHDDTGDEELRDRLRDTYPQWDVIATPGRSGFAGAYRSMWTWVRDHDDNPFVFTTEDDFRFTRDVDLAAMATTLTTHRHLTQLALRRQPWNPTETAAGGIVEANPDAYTDCGDFTGQWLEHRQFHTTNPSLMRRDLFTGHEWLDGANSEGRFGLALFADPDAHAGFWGSRESGEWVDHIGETRVGYGY